jgi:integrase
MKSPANRAEDCKSSIVSSILTRASIPSCKELARGVNNFHGKFIDHKGDLLYQTYLLDVPVTISDHGSYVTLKFTYKGHSHKRRIYCPISDLQGSDIESVVSNFQRQVDGLVDLQTLLDFYLEHGTGSLATRKKNVAHIKDYCKRDGISLEESIKVLAKTDELGRTLPERWEEVYQLPHKLRQVRSIFGRKNLSLFKRKGWDTKCFGNFLAFVPQSTVSQPFTTSDDEVEHIIKFFNDAKEDHPVFYDIYLLAFGCGLRQSEIYQVRYEDFTTFNGQCYLNLPFATKRTKLKGLNGHVEKVPVSRQVFDHFTNKSTNGIVIEGANRLHKRFVKFLKNEVGITENKACHRLRKILGARLATTHGIYHASKQLRNSVSVCEKYYSDLTSHRNELMV